MKKITLAIAAILFSASIANAEITGQFTTGVENRNPVDNLESITKIDSARITFHTVLTELNGMRVFHVWKNGSNEIYRHTINVGSDRWRVWSSISLDHVAPGDTINVEVQNEEGEVLSTNSIKVDSILIIDEDETTNPENVEAVYEEEDDEIDETILD